MLRSMGYTRLSRKKRRQVYCGTRSKSDALEKVRSGISVVGDVSWGTHFCQFYLTRQDLIDILVPYFKQGLENNEYCMWVTSKPLQVKDAWKALRRAVKNLDNYIAKGQIEVLDYRDWYMKAGGFKADRVLGGWVKKERQALKKGFKGLRLTGNTLWLERKNWRSFSDYESMINRIIGKHRMIAVCSYSLEKCKPSDIVDVVNSHQFAIIRREKEWRLIRGTEYKAALEALAESEERYRGLFENSKDAVTINTPEGKFIDFNQAYLDLLGYSRNELLELNVVDTYADPADRDEFRKEMERNGFVKDFEVKLRRKDGAPRDCLVTSAVWKNKGGHILGYQGLVRDITERKQREETLRRSEIRYVELTESISDVFFAMDSDLRYTYWNKASENLTGISAKDALGKSVFDVFPDNEDTRRAVATYREVLKTRQHKSFINEYRLGDKNFVFEIDVYPAGDGISIFTKDVTERTRAEKAIEDLARYPSENPNPVLRASKDGFILHANPASELLLQSWGCKVGDEAPKYWRDVVAEVFASQSARNVDVELGEKVILFTITPVKDTSYVNLYGRDITDRKRMEHQLRFHSENLEGIVEARIRELSRSEVRYRLLVDNMADAVFTIDLEGNVTFVNLSTEKLTGYPTARLLKMNMKEIIAPEHYRTILERLQARIRGETYLPIIEFETMRADGKRLPIEMRTSPVCDEKGTLIGVQGIARDITDRKRVEAELRESELRFRRIYEASMNALYTTSLEGDILDMNPAGVSLFGFNSLDGIKKVNMKSLYVDLGDRERFVELMTKGPVRDFAARFKRKDGGIVETLINAYPLRDENGKLVAFQGAIIDVTDQKELEKMRDRLMSTAVADITRQKELEKMKDQFISTVTHELRTPLVSIKGYIDYIVSGELGSLPAEVASSLDVARRNTDRLLSLTNDLLDIQRLQAGRLRLNLGPLNLRQVLAECVQEIKPFIDQKKQCLNLVVEETLPVQGDPVRLSQMLANLLVNASKFTPEGGAMTLRARAKDDTIEVQVSDTGIGIRKQDLMRVFEPFAAIEKPSYIEGAGLGLSITKGLVEAHGGKIWVESLGEGKGATFTFVLPRWKEAA